jgi:hypothetical protein
METQLFIIGYGLSGGYGGIHDYEVIEADSREDAEDEAYVKACDMYENYLDGTNLRDVSDIMEEDEVDEEYAIQVFYEERENWLEYVTLDYNEENLKEVEGYRLENPFE